MHMHCIVLAFPQKIFHEDFTFLELFVQFMVSDIDSSLNLDYPSSVTSTNVRIPQSKASPVHEHTRPARDNESKKDSLNGRKLFYCNYCSYGNAVIINLRLHLFNQYEIQIKTRVNHTKATAIEKLLDFWNTVMEDRTISQLEFLVLEKILNKDISQKALLELIIIRNLFLSIV
jgi:hypothetical protein